MASVLKLPNVFVIENNQYAYSTPLRCSRTPTTSRSRRSPTAFPGVTVDGTDVLAVHDAVAEAVARARAGDGPSIVEGVTMRMHGHAEHDPADYVPKEMFEEWAKKDPVELFEKRAARGRCASTTTPRRQSGKTPGRRPSTPASKALADPMPDPSNIEEGVYAD